MRLFLRPRLNQRHMAFLLVQRRIFLTRPDSPIGVLLLCRQHHHGTLLSRHRLPCLRSPSRPSTLTCMSIIAPALQRGFHIEGLMLAPVVFAGLFVALWTWKCCMLVIFQHKIIFMPGMPPNSRWETIEEYAPRCAGIKWRTERIRAVDGTDLALCITDLTLGATKPPPSEPASRMYILYFQGNAASTPPRLPDLSSMLNMLKRHMHQDIEPSVCTMVCLSYRGYWTSRGRPNENGIRLDTNAALQWISTYHAASSSDTSQGQVIYWGQSVGSGIATNLAADQVVPPNLYLDSLILETPFTSIRAMLAVLYPQKWLPYQYLWPFLRTHLNSGANLGLIAERYKSESTKPQVLILEAAKDELVPQELSQQLFNRCQEVGLEVQKEAVHGAFHNDTMFRAEGRRIVSSFLAERLVTHRTRKPNVRH